uniref:Uncharacterized protein n=1 Tax=Heterorhabditis bacteriophora TaxID=37862 RepID=A0A1I7WKV7_HETBA
MFPVRVEHRLYEQCWSCRLTKKSSITGGYVSADAESLNELFVSSVPTTASIGKSTQLTCFLCRVNTYWQSVLALAMDRLIRVSMKNAASCVIYHELQTFERTAPLGFPFGTSGSGLFNKRKCLKVSLNESSVILTTLRRAVYC